jgi:hypothetical protein
MYGTFISGLRQVELKKILLAAERRAEEDLLVISTYDFTLNDGVEEGKLLPKMNLCVLNAKLKGQEITAFAKLSHHAQFTQRSWQSRQPTRHQDERASPVC